MRNPFLLFSTAIGLLAIVFTTGCASLSNSSASDHREAPSGAKLWAQNCTRCHNSRSPAEFSDAQWEIVSLHMRVRANLTAQEHRSILEFLQSAN